MDNVNRIGLCRRRRRYPFLLEGLMLLSKHKKRVTLAAFFIVSEIISFCLDAFGRRQWGFLLAALVLSLLVLATTVLAERASLRPQNIINVVEISFSAIQFIGATIRLVEAGSDVKININESVYLLVFATIVFLFALREDGTGEVNDYQGNIHSYADPNVEVTEMAHHENEGLSIDSISIGLAGNTTIDVHELVIHSSPTFHNCDDRLPDIEATYSSHNGSSVDSTSNDLTGTTTMDVQQPVGHSSLAFHSALTGHEVNCSNQLPDNIEGSHSLSCERGISSLEETRTVEFSFVNCMTKEATTMMDTIDEPMRHMGNGSSTDSHMALTDYEVNHNDQLQHIEVHMLGDGVKKEIDLAASTCFEDLYKLLGENFSIGEVLCGSGGKWLLCFDGNNNRLILEEHPWDAFCKLVRKIYIRAEVNDSQYIANQIEK